MLRSSSLILTSKQTEPCQECGTRCQRCINNSSLDLHHEIEDLKAKLAVCNMRMIQMEEDFTNAQRSVEFENSRLQDELARLRDRYDRLFESHKKLQKLNHNLESNLLSLVEKFESEKRLLTQNLAILHSQLLQAKVTMCDLEEDSERYRSDCNLAVQLLQCKPNHFVQHKFGTLPLDLQQRVRLQLTKHQVLDIGDCNRLIEDKQQDLKVIRVPMSTFPPTAIVYSVDKTNDTLAPPCDADTVPMTLIARVLSKPLKHRPGRIVICSRCHAQRSVTDTTCQTLTDTTCQTDDNSSN